MFPVSYSINLEGNTIYIVLCNIIVFKWWINYVLLKFSFIYSITFIWTLASTKAGVSTIIPVTNGMKFFITFLAGKYICKETGNVFSARSLAGLFLIGIGVILQLLNI